MIESIIRELKQDFISASGSHIPKPETRFHKHKEYLTYGLSTPEFRDILSRYKSRFNELTIDKRIELAKNLLSEHIGELTHTGIYLFSLSVDEVGTEHFNLLDDIPEDFHSWSHVDHFCSDVMEPMLLRYREKTLTLLRKWNKSPCRWKRRASVVTFTRKIGESGEFTDEVLSLCNNLIRDKEDIVLKGVGWALKDNMRSDRERIIEYVKGLRRKGVSSTITLYAIRDLKGSIRKEILNVKKE